MKDERIQPWERDVLDRLHIVCRELQQAATRIETAALLASLPDDSGVITYTSKHGRITFARGSFDLDVSVTPGEQPCMDLRAVDEATSKASSR